MDVNIVEVLCSRLCHDLVNPVGAIRNGMELLEDAGPDGGFAGEAVRLIAHSADQADHRLKLFRLTYGRAGRDARDFRDARAAAGDWLAGGRTRLDWPDDALSHTLAARPGVAKLVLCLVVSAEEALAVGGVVSVAGRGDTGSGTVEVTATGRDVRFSTEMEAALTGRATSPEPSPRTVHAHVTAAFASAYDMGIGVSSSPSRLVLTLSW